MPTYASNRGPVSLDRTLYLPRCWTDDLLGAHHEDDR